MVRVNVSHPDPTDADVGRLIEQYKPLVMFVAKSLGFCQIHHYHNGLELEDAMQLGYIALWKASKTFDPSKASSEGTAFAAYAATKIRHEIFNEVRRCRWGSFEKYHKKRMGKPQIVPFNDWDKYSRDSVEDEVERLEWLERIDESVSKMDFKRRTIYQGYMRHEDVGGKSRKGQDYYGLSSTRVHQIKLDIRKKLREALH